MADGLDDYAYLDSLSLHRNRAGDTANLNPLFAAKLAAAIRDARAQGLDVGVMSAFREPGQTGSAYDAGGNSSHSYGLASDISGLDGANGRKTQAWAAIAANHGLYNPYGAGDPAEFNHWQYTAQPLEKIPGALDALKAAKGSGDWNSVWSAAPNPQSGAAPYATGYAAQPASNPLLANLIQFESGGKNITNTSQTTSSGRARGLLQITDGTWREFGTPLGIDFNKYPTAQDAPANLQWAVGSTIPLSRWDPKTLNYLSQKGISFDPTKTLGQNAAAYGPVDPSIIARGGVSPPLGGPTGALASGGGGILPGFSTQQASNQFTQGIETLDKAMGGTGTPWGQGGGQVAQAPQGPSPMIGPPPMAQHVSELLPASRQIQAALTGYSPGVYGNTLTSVPGNLQWASSTPQAPAWMKAGQAPDPYGTSLTGLQQLAMQTNPMFNQGYGYGY